VAVGERERAEQTGAADPPPVVGEREGTTERARDHVRGDHDHDGVRDRHEHGASARDVRLRQRDAFGGFNWGSAFFGWLVAIGLGALLTALLSAAGTAIGLTEASESGARENAETIGIVGGALLILIGFVAYYCGGYVAGRMSRFDGARQGFGVWAFGLVMTLLLAAAGAMYAHSRRAPVDHHNVNDEWDGAAPAAAGPVPATTTAG
jgi:hypothetical protein